MVGGQFAPAKVVNLNWPGVITLIGISTLEGDFFDNDSEIETAARENISMDIFFIAKAYSFDNADIEQLVAPRNW